MNSVYPTGSMPFINTEKYFGKQMEHIYIKNGQGNGKEIMNRKVSCPCANDKCKLPIIN